METLTASAFPDWSGEVGGVNALGPKSLEVPPFLSVAGAGAPPSFADRNCYENEDASRAFSSALIPSFDML
jgi:hypothetical protein